MNQQGKGEAEEDLGGEDDNRIDPGRAQRIVKQGIAQSPCVVAQADQGAIVGGDRLPDGQHERDRHDNEHGAERRQKDGVSEPLLTVAPAPPGPGRLRARRGREFGGQAAHIVKCRTVRL